MTVSKNSLDRRLTRLESQSAASLPVTAMSWIWVDGRLHCEETGEIFASEEERSRAYAGKHVFIDHVIVDAKDGRPVAYSDGRSVEEHERERRRR